MEPQLQAAVQRVESLWLKHATCAAAAAAQARDEVQAHRRKVTVGPDPELIQARTSRIAELEIQCQEHKCLILQLQKRQMRLSKDRAGGGMQYAFSAHVIRSWRVHADLCRQRKVRALKAQQRCKHAVARRQIACVKRWRATTRARTRHITTSLRRILRSSEKTLARESLIVWRGNAGRQQQQAAAAAALLHHHRFPLVL
jgi:hypothetical protein